MTLAFAGRLGTAILEIRGIPLKFPKPIISAIISERRPSLRYNGRKTTATAVVELFRTIAELTALKVGMESSFPQGNCPRDQKRAMKEAIPEWGSVLPGTGRWSRPSRSLAGSYVSNARSLTRRRNWAYKPRGSQGAYFGLRAVPGYIGSVRTAEDVRVCGNAGIKNPLLYSREREKHDEGPKHTPRGKPARVGARPSAWGSWRCPVPRMKYTTRLSRQPLEFNGFDGCHLPMEFQWKVHVILGLDATSCAPDATHPNARKAFHPLVFSDIPTILSPRFRPFRGSCGPAAKIAVIRDLVAIGKRATPFRANPDSASEEDSGSASLTPSGTPSPPSPLREAEEDPFDLFSGRPSVHGPALPSDHPNQIYDDFSGEVSRNRPSPQNLDDYWTNEDANSCDDCDDFQQPPSDGAMPFEQL
ncbi:hypothetical protein FB451DRAFT_1177071 [Mycena latifolia]|nr:hypothetical protein FB451DRAFT_1177071 [Mycena latifolia]